jgi:hypothetical protein
MEDPSAETLPPRHETPQTPARDTAVVPSLSKSAVPAVFEPTPTSIKIGIASMAAVAIFLLGVWWARRDVVATPIAASPSPTVNSIFSGLPPPPSRGGPAPVEDEPALDPPPEETSAPTAPPSPIPASVQAAKKGLVERIRSLRRTKFDGDFQRRLTALSSRVTRARTEEEIAEISGQLSRMERE